MEPDVRMLDYPGAVGHRYIFIALSPGPTVMYKGVKARVYAMSIDLSDDQWIAEIGTYTAHCQDGNKVKLTSKKEWVYLRDCEPDMEPEKRNAELIV